MATTAPTILVVEDSDTLRSLIVDVLELDGYRVLEAANGVRAVRLLAEQKVDAVLLDVRLGPENGIALGSELRLHWPDLPIALMSGDSTAPDADGRAKALTDVFIAKPVTPDRLTSTIEKLLGG